LRTSIEVVSATVLNAGASSDADFSEDELASGKTLLNPASWDLAGKWEIARTVIARSEGASL
jgi:hypothetical protein